MWAYLKWTVRIIILAVLVAIIHYSVPHHDVVRITDTYNREALISYNWLFYAGSDVGTTQTELRDIRFIETVRPNGAIRVYRNEDTGWLWPPYFKYGSTNLQAEASDLTSTKDAPQWVVVSYYGWRNSFFEIYPNAVGMRPVARPDVTIVPWASLIVLLMLAVATGMLVWAWGHVRQWVLRTLSRG